MSTDKGTDVNYVFPLSYNIIFNKVHLVFFGNKNTYKLSLERLKKEALNFGFHEDKIHRYTEDDLPEDFKLKHKCRETIAYGYYMWKPYVILDAISKIKSNEILVYVDCGCSINNQGMERFLHYMTLMQNHDILCCNTRFFPDSSKRFLEKSWTKYDLISYMNAEKFNDTVQICGGFNIYKNTAFSKTFLEKWLHIGAIHNCHFSNDDQSKIKNDTSFSEHRHDQSIFSLLVKTNNENKNIICLEDEIVCTINNKKFPFWATRIRR